MITAKEAANVAKAYAREVYDPEELEFMRLEEVELSGDHLTWLITLGWVEPAVYKDPGFLFGDKELRAMPRTYKLFSVDAENGQVTSMKIRQL